MRKRQPDTEAQRLVQTYADLILRLGYTYLKSTHDAEDVCQNVLIKLLQTDRAFESAEHERAWIVRATANACKDVLRSARRRTSVALDAVAEAAAPEVPDSAWPRSCRSRFGRPCTCTTTRATPRARSRT